VAVQLARSWPLAVISADARQIYRGLDIGTGKPSQEQQRLAPHLGLDLVEPGERYSAGRFARDAAGWIATLEPHRRPVIVGGTGLYIRALAEGLFQEPEMNRERRDRLRVWTGVLDGPARWATRLDPHYSGGGRQRATRTIEVALLTGRALSWWQRHARIESEIRPWYIRLALPRVLLHRRIAERVDHMLASGLVEEVRGLLARGVADDAPGLDAVGYRETIAYFRGALSEDELPGAIAGATRRYAKRQDTWFRHQLLNAPVITLDATDPVEMLARRIADLWETRAM
jgi:tRNA dimethylallyltransferase